MRIAIYHNLPSGGAKRALYEFVTRATKKHEIDLFRMDLPENESFLDLRPLVRKSFSEPLNYKPRHFKGAGLLEPMRFLASALTTQRRLAEQIDAGNYDVVYVTNCFITQNPAILSFLKTKAVLYMHEPRRRSFEPESAPERSGGKLRVLRQLLQDHYEARVKTIDKAAAKSASRILCNSRFTAEAIKKYYGLQADTSYLGVDTAMFKLGENPRDGFVLSVGALYPVKGHEDSIKALANIENPPSFHVIFDREMPGYRKGLETLARSAGVELVLHHRIPDSELVRLYQAAGAVLCAAIKEPFGFTPLEAMACGAPVVAVRDGGYLETISDETGILCERQPEDIADAVQSILSGSRKFDPKGLRSYVMDNWTWTQAVERQLTYLEQV